MSDDIQHVQLVRRSETKRAIIDGVMASRPVHPASTRTEVSMANLARTFNVPNLQLLAQLRALGHVSLDTAAETLGFASTEAFVMRTMDGLNLYIDFHPTPDGKPGVRVPFNKLQIDLDIDPVA
jgi:predicted transcriptional regulator